MEKRVAMDGNTATVNSSGWALLPPEILGLILARMPADEVLRNVSFVCRSWREALTGPYCWAEIDLEQWCRRVNNAHAIDAAVRKLVRRSAGTLCSLSAYRLGNSAFSFACSSGKFMRVLRMPMSEVSDRMLEEHFGSLSMLTTIDISYCLNVSWRGIEVIGKHCKNLLQLRRNIPPPGIDMGSNNVAAVNIDELEAMAIAGSMPGLEHLELAFGRFSDHGLLAVVTKCKLLRVLDIRGCWNVKMHGDLGLLCDTIPSFKDPWEDEYEIPDSPADEGGNPPQPLMGSPIAVAEEDDEWDWDDEGDDTDTESSIDYVVDVSDDDDDGGPVDVIELSD